MATSSKKWKASYDSNRKYNSNWQNTYPWLKKSSDGSEAAFCTRCQCTIVPKISNISKHEQSNKHMMTIKNPSKSLLPLTTKITHRNSRSLMRLNKCISNGQLKQDRPVSPFLIPDISEISCDMQEVIEEANEKNSRSLMRLNRGMSNGQLKQDRPVSPFLIPDSEISCDMQEVIEEANEKKSRSLPSDMGGVIEGAKKKNSQSLIHLNRCMSSGQSEHGHPISRFPIPDISEVPPDMQEAIEEAKRKGGFIPNIFKTLAHRPNEMRAFVKYHNAVMEIREGGNLTKGDKEMIIVAVSAYNKCTYDIIAHSALSRIYTKNTMLADQVAANWETADIDDRQRAILNFAMAVAKCQPLSNQHFEELYRHGLDQEDAWDIGSVVALFSLSNRMAFLTGMVANEELYMLGRIPRPPKDSKL